MPDHSSDLLGFATTRWSLVRRAGSRREEGQEALQQLCTAYWPPVYAFLRRRAPDVETAHDWTQEFFARLLARGDFERADESRGRFRAFLLTAVKHFVVDQRRFDRAAKRGGGAPGISRDALPPGLAVEPTRSNEDPERAYQRTYALAMLDGVMARVAGYYAGLGKQDLFEVLRPCLVPGPDRPSYAAIGPRLGLSEGAVKVAVHRLRQRFERTLRQRILETVTDPAEIDGEIDELFRALAGE